MGIRDIYSNGQMPISNAIDRFFQAKDYATTKRLMPEAMSGKPEAINQLMAVNPQAAMQVQQNLFMQQQKAEQVRQQGINNKIDAAKAGGSIDDQGNFVPGTIGGFQGNAMDAQAMTLLAQGEKDPSIKSTPEYKLAKAYAEKPQPIQTEQGIFMRPGINVDQVFSGKSSEQPTDIGQKTSPLQKEYNDKYQAMEGFGKTLNSYRQLLEKLGPQISVGPLNAEDATKLKTAYTALMVEGKNAFELGAISGPDMGIIQSWVPDPSGIKGFSTGKEGLMSGLDQVSDYIGKKQDTFHSAYEGENVKRKKFSPLIHSPKKEDIPQGWTLHEDANGNKAYVSPDGKQFKVVK